MNPTEQVPLVLESDEQALLLQELEDYVAVMPEGRQAAYRPLLASVQEGRVPPEHLSLLGEVLALSLMSGRARRRYTAEGERLLTDLFRRTPAGREVEAQLAQVNRALTALRDRSLESVRVSMRTLGHFTLRLEAGGVAVVLAFRPDGVVVESVAAG